MCQVKVSCSGGSGAGGAGAAVAVAGLAFVVVSAVVSVISSVVTAVAAVVSSLLWVIGGVGALGVLGATAVFVTREVLDYRAEQRIQLVLAARAAALRPAPAAASGQMVVGGRRLPLTTGGGAR